MTETAGLASASVDGDADVADTVDAAEQIAQVAVGHFVGHVANEEGVGGGKTVVERGPSSVGVGDDDAATFVVGHVEFFDGSGGGFGVLELDVAETAEELDESLPEM